MPHKLCHNCDTLNGTRAFNCKACGFAFKQIEPKRTKVVFAEDFATRFKQQLDAIKQKPPGERKK